MSEYSCFINILSSLDWQRDKAEKLKEIIQNKQDWHDENFCEFWEDWKVNVFSLETASEFGLSVWAKILDEDIGGTSPQFNTEERRIILKLKAYKLMKMSGSTHEINRKMKELFGDGALIVLDGLDMSFVYLLNDPDLINIATELKERDLLPRPIGIGEKLVNNEGEIAWGFGNEFNGFNNGNFYDGAL